MTLANAAIATARREATAAAESVLLHGGNAMDAAIAAVLVQTMIEPSNTGLGGYGGILTYYEAKTGKVHGIDFDSRAPLAYTPNLVNANNANHGYRAIGVPGIIAGIDLAIRTFGTKSFKELSQPALSIAANGQSLDLQIADAFKLLANSTDPASYHAYFKNGVPPQSKPWVQADVAKLLRRLADEGPMSFYTGDIASTIVKQVQANGGILTEEDFHTFKARVVEPLTINYRGYDLYTPPSPAAGLTAFSILKTLEQFDLSKVEPWSPQYYDLYVEAAKLVWAERFKYFGDPDFVKIPSDDLLSEKAAVDRASKIRYGIPAAPIKPPVQETHTVNIAVVDTEGNAVSLTATHGGNFGSHVVIDGLGLVLGHGNSRFDFQPNTPNFPAPGKRPQHNMCPAIALRNGKPEIVVGLPGGRHIVSMTAQLFTNVIDFGCSPLEAVLSPRVHIEAEPPLKIAASVNEEVATELKLMGHEIKRIDAVGGDCNVVVIDPATRIATAGASSGPGTWKQVASPATHALVPSPSTPGEG